MIIRTSTDLQRSYNELVKLSKEAQEPIFLTDNRAVEMVFLPIELWERREAELDLLEELLHREQNRNAGARTSTMEEMEALTAALV